MFGATSGLRAWLARRSRLRAEVRSTIEDEGGVVESVTMIGLLLRSPFPPINLRPVYQKVRCRYPKDRGAWYVCDASGGPTHWVWKSANGLDEPPAVRRPPARVDNSVLALPRWVSVLLYLLFVAGMAAAIWFVGR